MFAWEIESCDATISPAVSLLFSIISITPTFLLDVTTTACQSRAVISRPKTICCFPSWLPSTSLVGVWQFVKLNAIACVPKPADQPRPVVTSVTVQSVFCVIPKELLHNFSRSTVKHHTGECMFLTNDNHGSITHQLFTTRVDTTSFLLSRAYQT